MDNKKQIIFVLNDREIHTALPAGTPLVDFIRNDQHLTGTRIGCREGDCGACSVLLGTPGPTGIRYRTVTSCLFPLADAAGCHVVSVEGLNCSDGLTPVQRVFVVEGASQCGFCTPGLIVSLTGFLLDSHTLQEDDAITAIEGNICRCTGYTSIRRALAGLLDELRTRLQSGQDRLQALIRLGVVPEYFATIADRLPPAIATEELPQLRDKDLVLAGGTDLYVRQGAELADRELRRISRHRGLSAIWPESDCLYIGAAATVSDMMESPLLAAALPGLADALRLVSSQQIRNRATVGGNIVNASPIGDLSVILLALDAEIAMVRGDDLRIVRLRDFFLGYKKLDLEDQELVTWLRIPVRGDRFRFHFEKVSRRRHQDIASVNTAISLEMDGERVVTVHASAGGVAPVPYYFKKAAAVLAGRDIDVNTLRDFLDQADREIAPISDVRGSAAYKRTLLRRLLCAHFLDLFPGRFTAGDLL